MEEVWDLEQDETISELYVHEDRLDGSTHAQSLLDENTDVVLLDLLGNFSEQTGALFG